MPADTVFGQRSTVSAIVTAPGTDLVPRGEVRFLAGDAVLATVELDETGQAVATLGALAVGEHALTARYAGTDTLTPSASSPVTQQVAKAQSATTLRLPEDAVSTKQDVTLVAAVEVLAPGAATPSGEVAFRDGQTLLGTASLTDQGTATLAVGRVAVGSHALSATYGGSGVLTDSSDTGELVVRLNTPPTASVSMEPAIAAAPVDVLVSVAGGDADGDPLTFVLDLGDGSAPVTGTLPHAPIPHRYEQPGTYVASFTVTDGEQETVQAATVRALVDPGPLVAVAGDDQRVVVGAPAQFDASGSRPIELITAYHWDFGDGASATSPRPVHEYAAPGTYAVTLTARRGTETSTDATTVTVIAAPVAPGLLVRVTGGGAPLSGADALVILPDATRISAVTGNDGMARLDGLPDGDVTVYAWAEGFQPQALQAAVSGGSGQASVDLASGEVGAATLEQHRMTYDEILAAGIDVADPENSNVYEAKIHLYFDPDDDPTEQTTVRFAIAPEGLFCLGYCPGWDGGGGGGGGGGGCCLLLGGYQYLPSLTYVDKQPFIHWLVIPVRASWLKEFFEVRMMVQNVLPGFTFTSGTAALDLPAGLSLAPTSTRQTTVVDMPDIPAGRSRTATWVVRGDVEGFYDLSTSYAGVIAPIGKSVSLTARTRDPLHVWGASALKMEILADAKAVRWGPYQVDVRLTNVSDVPVYNAMVEMLDRPADATPDQALYFFAPSPPQAQGTPVIAPGEAFTASYVVFAGLGSDEIPRLKLVLERSFVERTGGNVDLKPTIAFRDGTPLGPNAGPVTVRVDRERGVDDALLSWPRPAAPTGRAITGFRIYGRDTLMGGTWRELGTAPLTDEFFQTYRIRFEDKLDAGRYYAVGTVYDDETTAFRNQLGVGLSRYVSLGDSYSSGEGVPAFDPGTARDYSPVPAELKERVPFDNLCHRSAMGSYGRLLVADRSVDAHLEPATFAACSGAIADDFVVANPRNEGEPKQLAHLNQWTDVVSLSVGGNDAGFPDVAALCLFSDCNEAINLSASGQSWGIAAHFAWNGVKVGTGIFEAATQCSNPVSALVAARCAYSVHELGQDAQAALGYVTNGERLADASFAFTDAPVLRSRLRETYKKVAAAAPDARVYVQLYPRVVEDSQDTTCRLLGDDITTLTQAERIQLNRLVEAINDNIRRAVKDVNLGLKRGAQLEVVESAKLFEDKELCLPDGRPNPASAFNSFVNEYVSVPGNYGPLAFSFHPNKTGQEMYAQALATQVARGLGKTVLVPPRASVNAGEVFVPYGSPLMRARATWPGSTVTLSVVSPSGKKYDRQTPGTRGGVDATSTWLEVLEPEQGRWTVQLFGDDVRPGGEPTSITAHAQDPAPMVPAASFEAAQVETRTWIFTAPAAPAGTTHRWVLSDGTVLEGESVTHTFTGTGPDAATLQVVGPTGETAWAGESTSGPLPPTVFEPPSTGGSGEDGSSGGGTSGEPTTGPTTGPTSGPTSGPTTGPTTGPTSEPTTGPTTGPTSEPTPDEPEVAPAPERPQGMTRLAGQDRFTTAAAVSRGSFPGTANDVFIVTGMNWPDALSAGPAATKRDAPVLPVQAASIPDAIGEEINRLRPRRAWIIGGASVVSDSVLNDLRGRGIQVTRISGADRYETAAAVASRFFPDVSGAYYASGAGYADALGGGAAAAKRGWPLLLTAKDSLPPAIPILGSERIVLGGSAAISDTVQARLGARRVAGTDRFSTAAAIARNAFPSATVGYLATGLNFPDALAGAPAAARDGAPLLLAANDCVTTATRDAFSALGVTSRVVLGGTAVVSDRAAILTTC